MKFDGTNYYCSIIEWIDTMGASHCCQVRPRVGARIAQFVVDLLDYIESDANLDWERAVSAADEYLIHGIIEEEQAAWNAGDAKTFAARFHAEGSFTNVFGDRYFGQESFRARHAAIFNTFAKGSKVFLTVRRIHFPAPGTAVVDVDCVLEASGTLPPGLVPAPDGTLRTSLLQVLVKDGDEWWTVGYHDVDVKPRPAGAQP